MDAPAAELEPTERDGLVSGLTKASLRPPRRARSAQERDLRQDSSADARATPRRVEASDPSRRRTQSAANSRGRCSWRCLRWLCLLALLFLASFLLAMRFGIVAYDPSARWWPWTWSDKVRAAMSTKNNLDEWLDGERQWRRSTDARLASLEASMSNTTARVAAAEAERAVLRAEIAAVQAEISELKTEGYGNASDPALRDEMRRKFDAVEAENARRDERFGAVAEDLATRLNATDERERRDALAGETALEAQAAAARDYADARAGNVLDSVDARLADVYSTIGDYKETTQVRFDSERDLIYDWIAGTFALLCFLVSLAGVYAHTRALAVPDVQRKILALLWMPPIYSTCCWLSLLYPSSSAGLGMVRDGYEAYTIWVFVSFLVAVLGDAKRPSPSSLNAAARGDGHQPRSPPLRAPTPTTSEADADTSSYSRVVSKLEADGDRLPRAFCPPCGKASARSFLKQCMVATLQFVVLKPSVSVADYVLAAAAAQQALVGPATESETQSTTSPDWIARTRAALFVLENLSVSVAFTGLLKVYHAVAHHLASHNPW